MFKIISKRKYEAMKDHSEEWRKTIEELHRKRSDELSSREAHCLKIEDTLKKAEEYIGILRAERDEYEKGYVEYKTLYLDELQKRLDLADKVRWIEQEGPISEE